MKRILFVNDDSVVTRLYSEALKMNGNFTAAASIAEALEIIPKIKPDIVVSRYQMPRKNGYEFLKEVKELYPSAVRVLVDDVPARTHQPLEEAAHVFIRNPSELKYLLDKLS